MASTADYEQAVVCTSMSMVGKLSMFGDSRAGRTFLDYFGTWFFLEAGCGWLKQMVLTDSIVPVIGVLL